MCVFELEFNKIIGITTAIYIYITLKIVISLFDQVLHFYVLEESLGFPGGVALYQVSHYFLLICYRL